MVRDRLAELHDERGPVPLHPFPELNRGDPRNRGRDESGAYGGGAGRGGYVGGGNGPYGQSGAQGPGSGGRAADTSACDAGNGGIPHGSEPYQLQRQRQQQDRTYDVRVPTAVAYSRNDESRLPRHQEQQLPVSSRRASSTCSTKTRVASGPQTEAYEMTDLSGFLAKIGQLNADIECLNGNISDISRYQSYTLEESQQYAQERKVKALEEETTARMNQVKNQIKAIEIENAKMPDNSPELALRRNHHGQLRKKFLEVVQQYSQLEVDHRAKIRQKMERQYRIVRPDASPEEVNEFFDRNDGGHLFAQALINPQRYNDASRTLDEVRSRHQDMVKLESTIAELARMYEEVATLVQAQHETVVSVEKHVDTTEAHLTQATAQIDRAQESARKVRRHKWCLLIICLVVLAGAALVIYLMVGKGLFSSSP